MDSAVMALQGYIHLSSNNCAILHGASNDSSYKKYKKII
jgi:hypothetical protein